MIKEDLKQFIVELKLDPQLEKLLLDLVDNSQTVDQTLLNTVADILDNQADFLEKTADILEEEAQEYEALNEEFNLIDQEEYSQRLEAIKENQEALLTGLEQKIKENSPNTPLQTNAPQPDVNAQQATSTPQTENAHQTLEELASLKPE